MNKQYLLTILIWAICTGAYTQPTNNTCPQAILINNLAAAQIVSVNLNNATESLKASCEDSTKTFLDVWYTFTMPFDGKLNVSSVTSGNYISLFDACGGTELYCQKGGGYWESLSSGTTYYLRYSANPNALLVDDIRVQAFALPSNDMCTQALPISNLEVLQTISIDNRGATESIDISCETSSDDNFDLWYQFTMPFDGKIKLSGLSVVRKMALFDSCGGNELQCLAGTGFFQDLDSGRNYLLRYGSAAQYAGPATMNIQAFTLPDNDDCSHAITLPNIVSLQSISLDNRGATESLDVSCEDAAGENLDLWYQFTMPFDGKIKLSGLSVVRKMALFDSCGGNELQCLAGTGFFQDLDSGSTYLLRYGSSAQNAGPANLSIQAFAPLINDECPNAIAISNIVSEQSIFLDNRGATESLDASCEDANEDNLDLWYSFTMPFDGKIRLKGISIVERVVLYDSCGGGEKLCMTGSGFIKGLIGGNTYLLRYSSTAAYALTNTITIQAFPPPSNDECEQATSLGNITTAQMIQLDTRGATESLNASCEDAAEEHLDLWYSFTMPFDGKVEVSGVFGVNRLVLFDSCGGTELGCFKGDGFFYGLSAGKSYVLRYAALAEQSLGDQITVQAFPVVINDECANAITIPPLDTVRTIILDTREATESLDASCEDPMEDNHDLWYQFTMPFDGQLKIDDVFGVNKLVLYDSCGGNELACIAGNGFFDVLTGGNSYILRYAAVSLLADRDEFTLEAFSPLPNDECTQATLISQVDSFQIITVDNRQGTESLDASCEDSTHDNLDLWYQFTMPFQGKLMLTQVNNAHRISLWDACGGNELACFSGSDSILNLNDSTTYWLRYASPSLSAAADAFGIQAVMTTSIEQDQTSVLQFRLYPQPAHDQLHIEWQHPSPGPVHIQLTDMSGRALYTHATPVLYPATQTINLNIHRLPPGMYLLRLEIQGISYIHRFIHE